jgi:hypothetical protein
MYSANRERPTSLPISEQFADVLETDIVNYVDSIRRLDDPSITAALQEARRRMLDEHILCRAPDSTGLGTMVAVDGGNNVLQTGAATQCFILSVRYSLRPDFDVNFSMERLIFDSGEPAALMYGVRNAMEIRDVHEVNETDSFCIVDNSWVSLLQNVNRTLVHYGNATPHDQRILEPFLRPMLAHGGHFITALRHPRNIALSKGGVSGLYCDRYGGGVVSLPDKVFLLGIMEAGEYTEPKALVDSGQGQLNVHTSDLFACHQTVESFYNADFNTTSDGFICSTYYKPHPWSPIKRIEFHRDLLMNGQQLFFEMLATIRDSMTIPTIQEPLEQFLVDEIVRRHTGHIPDLYQTAGVANIRDFDSAFAVQLVRRLRT